MKTSGDTCTCVCVTVCVCVGVDQFQFSFPFAYLHFFFATLKNSSHFRRRQHHDSSPSCDLTWGAQIGLRLNSTSTEVLLMLLLLLMLLTNKHITTAHWSIPLFYIARSTTLYRTARREWEWVREEITTKQIFISARNKDGDEEESERMGGKWGRRENMIQIIVFRIKKMQSYYHNHKRFFFSSSPCDIHFFYVIPLPSFCLTYIQSTFSEIFSFFFLFFFLVIVVVWAKLRNHYS